MTAQENEKSSLQATEFFVFSTNLAFLYMEDLKKFQQEIKLLAVEIELTTPTINGLEVKSLFHSAIQLLLNRRFLSNLFHAPLHFLHSDSF